MPRQIIEFRVVVASPSEMYESRRIVFDVIDELNRAFEIQKIAIRGLGWEEYATPGVGASVQEVINEQLLKEYDILIALFGTKLGTPTETAPSGTVEEIEQALRDGSNAMGHFRVQVYFLDRIEKASDISLDDFQRVVHFRNSLNERGVLYKLFREPLELQQEIRVNLQRPILEYLQKNALGTTRPERADISERSAGLPATTAAPEAQAAVEELGMLDYVERAENAIEAATTGLNAISEVINEIGKEMAKQTEAVERILSAPGTTTKEKKTLINDFASFIKTKALALKREAVSARENFIIYCGTLITIAAIERESSDPEKYKNDLNAMLSSVEPILAAIPESRSALINFRTAIENLPRITIQFNQAKRFLLEALAECSQLYDETEKSIYEIAGRT
jgi:hypothetical protein